MTMKGSKMGNNVGKHRGGICPACQHRILIRDGLLVDHIVSTGGIKDTENLCHGSQRKPLPEKVLR